MQGTAQPAIIGAAINTGRPTSGAKTGIIFQTENITTTNTIIGTIDGKVTVGTIIVGVIITDIITHIHTETTNIIITTIIMGM